MSAPINIYALSEKALTIQLGNIISLENHRNILSLQQFIKQLFVPGLTEMVPAYCSLTIYYDPVVVAANVPESKQGISKWIKNYLHTELSCWKPDNHLSQQSKITEIPVCYEEEFAPDLTEVANYHNTTKEEIIHTHTSIIYNVFMIGFSPGFPYLGILPDSIATPRKNNPRLKIPAGSVAIAGNQTGIYPSETPGGWNIIGRTPLKIFNKEKINPFMFSMGDCIKFFPVNKEYFLEHNQYD
ncbi:MAG TPA: 5-oxoprolinase subunit PxpB [Chitinophagaceae bacterium]|nr:5-oxoprolinase subunit PxpB [Chitinophagaceae bacterium]